MNSSDILDRYVCFLWRTSTSIRKHRQPTTRPHPHKNHASHPQTQQKQPLFAAYHILPCPNRRPARRQNNLLSIRQHPDPLDKNNNIASIHLRFLRILRAKSPTRHTNHPSHQATPLPPKTDSNRYSGQDQPTTFRRDLVQRTSPFRHDTLSCPLALACALPHNAPRFSSKKTRNLKQACSENTDNTSCHRKATIRPTTH